MAAGAAAGEKEAVERSWLAGHWWVLVLGAVGLAAVLSFLLALCCRCRCRRSAAEAPAGQPGPQPPAAPAHDPAVPAVVVRTERALGAESQPDVDFSQTSAASEPPAGGREPRRRPEPEPDEEAGQSGTTQAGLATASPSGRDAQLSASLLDSSVEDLPSIAFSLNPTH